ncbi:transposase, partial [Salmonella enterica subsp. enterica serovar Muenster]|nr:transposase [Salmonella enterica subsp. enterica serovar Muenster]
GLNTVRDMKETHDQLEGKSSSQLEQIADSRRVGEIERRLARKILRDRGER